MTHGRRLPHVDVSVSPERMRAIRDDVREYLVDEYHALQMVARLYRKAGLLHAAEQHEHEADRTVLMIHAIDDRIPANTGDDPQ